MCSLETGHCIMSMLFHVFMFCLNNNNDSSSSSSSSSSRSIIINNNNITSSSTMTLIPTQQNDTYKSETDLYHYRYIIHSVLDYMCCQCMFVNIFSPLKLFDLWADVKNFKKAHLYKYKLRHYLAHTSIV